MPVQADGREEVVFPGVKKRVQSASPRFGLLAFVLVAMIPRGVNAAAESRVIELAIRQGTLPQDQRVIRVRQGDEVTLRWTTDRPLTIHLHGYDIEAELTPGVPTSMRFSARATGRFPIEAHGSRRGEEATLGYLEVYPP